ncbi:hypothetical protein Tco_1339526 [Tanacetum coccineum]
MCLESWRRSSYARNLIKINACNGFSDNLVMTFPNLDGCGYTKEAIRVKYEWKPPHCSTCLIFGHPVDDCLKAPKRVVNKVGNSKGGSFGANDDGFTEVKKKKLGGNNGGTKNFKSISVKPKIIYRQKVNQLTEELSPKRAYEVSPKTNHSIGKKNVSITGNSSKKTDKMNASTSGNDLFPYVQEEDQSSTPLVEKINMFEQELLEGKCVLVDDEGKPLEKVKYSGDHES